MAYLKGVLDTVENFLAQWGVTGDTGIAISKAFLSPSLSNIDAVSAAFIAEGTTAPPELMNQLYDRYYSSIANNPAATSGNITQFLSQYGVWIAGGIAVLFFLKKRR